MVPTMDTEEIVARLRDRLTPIPDPPIGPTRPDPNES
jgi:hypothetical protein